MSFPEPILPPVRETTFSHAAVGTLVCGILSVPVWPVSVPTIIFGHRALAQIKRSAGTLRGKGLALAGLILGYVGFVATPLLCLPWVQISPEAQTAMAEARMVSIRLFLVENKKHHGTYPSRLEEVISLTMASSFANGRLYEMNAEWLVDPWGETFEYRFPGRKGAGEYELYSRGPDRKAGTEDDVYWD